MFSMFIDQYDFFMGLVLEHLYISFSVIIISIIVGGLIGILISEYNKFANYILNIINFLYTIPSISMLGILIPFLGIGNTTAIVALMIYAMLPMVRNTYTGLMEVDDKLVEAATAFGSTRLQVLYKIKLPLAMPMIISGIKSMAIMTIALTGIASFIGAGGLGVAIYRGITTNNGTMTLIGSLLIALISLSTDLFIGVMEKRNKLHKKTYFKQILIIVCLVISSIFVFNNNDDVETIHIATKPMTEQYILSNMLSILIEQETDLNVIITQGVGGGTSNIHPAMINGDFDMYIEYTGTAWNMVLGNDDMYDESLFLDMNTYYNDMLDMQWVGMYGFNNTYGIAIRSDIANMYDIKTYSDLSKISETLVFGGEYDFFGRLDGFDSLCSIYDLDFKSTKDMDIGLKYQAINQKQIDVMNVFTTDGLLSTSDVVLLEDDKQMYPSYMCGNIIRNDVLLLYPELSDVFSLIEGNVSDIDMADMSYQVESLLKDPYAVAYDFLIQIGLVK